MFFSRGRGGRRQTKNSILMNLCTLAFAAASLACGPALARHTGNPVDMGVLYSANCDSLVDGTGVPPQASLDAGNRTGVLLSYEFHATPNLGLQRNTSLGGSRTVDGACSLAAAGALSKPKPFSASVVSTLYEAPFEFTGKLKRLPVTLDAVQGVDGVAVGRADMAPQ